MCLALHVQQQQSDSMSSAGHGSNKRFISLSVINIHPSLSVFISWQRVAAAGDQIKSNQIMSLPPSHPN
jgi:hypothetical protein